jgi:hypothetical protein
VALFCLPVLVRVTGLLVPVGDRLDPAIGSKWVVGPVLLLAGLPGPERRTARRLAAAVVGRRAE